MLIQQGPTSFFNSLLIENIRTRKSVLVAHCNGPLKLLVPNLFLLLGEPASQAKRSRTNAKSPSITTFYCFKSPWNKAQIRNVLCKMASDPSYISWPLTVMTRTLTYVTHCYQTNMIISYRASHVTLFNFRF